MNNQPHTNGKAGRGRPSSFDRERGIELAQAIFHAKSYDAVGVAELTKILDIVPSSLYSAYGNKLALFELSLHRYMNAIMPLWEKILKSEHPPSHVLAHLFLFAAERYTREDLPKGDMVLEAMRADNLQAAGIASSLAIKIKKLVHDYVVLHVSPEDVDCTVDYVLMTLRGLSSNACLGYTKQQIIECAKVAGNALSEPSILGNNISRDRDFCRTMNHLVGAE